MESIEYAAGKQARSLGNDRVRPYETAGHMGDHRSSVNAPLVPPPKASSILSMNIWWALRQKRYVSGWEIIIMYSQYNHTRTHTYVHIHKKNNPVWF